MDCAEDNGNKAHDEGDGQENHAQHLQRREFVIMSNFRDLVQYLFTLVVKTCTIICVRPQRERKKKAMNKFYRVVTVKRSHEQVG